MRKKGGHSSSIVLCLLDKVAPFLLHVLHVQWVVLAAQSLNESRFGQTTSRYWSLLVLL